VSERQIREPIGISFGGTWPCGLSTQQTIVIVMALRFALRVGRPLNGRLLHRFTCC
jgi:hypothetical protein